MTHRCHVRYVIMLKRNRDVHRFEDMYRFEDVLRFEMVEIGPFDKGD